MLITALYVIKLIFIISYLPTSCDLKLVGSVFMLIAAWFVCGIASHPFMKAFEGEVPSSPVNVIVFLVAGWFFLFLSHFKSRQQV
jgi:hypothetical protein